MCGLAGIVGEKIAEQLLCNMADTISHRGPEETGMYIDEHIGVIHKRLKIVDLENGGQPAYNEEQNIIVIFNGEIYNYKMLRKILIEKGHSIDNASDTAILPHLYEEYKDKMFGMLSGQFAIAVWDKEARTLIMARDRLGMKPLFYTKLRENYIFASEIKAIMATSKISPKISPSALGETFTYWSPQNNRTIFKNVFSVLPGQIIAYKDGNIKDYKYWELNFEKECINGSPEELENLLSKAIEKRLMGNVPISAYLSGGLDSSLICGIMAKKYNANLETFSISFDDQSYDESQYQKYMANYLGIQLHRENFRQQEFAHYLKKSIWHTEVPLLRTGSIPMLKLSQKVASMGRKVVLTGEGADELFGGYDLFKEAKIKELIKRNPQSPYVKQLYKKVNRFVNGLTTNTSTGALNVFYNHNEEETFYSSHYLRWRQNRFFQRFLSEEIKNELDLRYVSAKQYISKDFEQYTTIQKAQLLEIETFLSRYLLSSQGDRVAMASSVECRYPYLDNQIIQYCLRIRDKDKIRGLNEKYLLKEIAKKYVPQKILERPKYPYRSPININVLLKDDYVSYVLEEKNIEKYNLFNKKYIDAFIRQMRQKEKISERELMLFMGVLTTQMICDMYKVVN